MSIGTTTVGSRLLPTAMPRDTSPRAWRLTNVSKTLSTLRGAGETVSVSNRGAAFKLTPEVWGETQVKMEITRKSSAVCDNIEKHVFDVDGVEYILTKVCRQIWLEGAATTEEEMWATCVELLSDWPEGWPNGLWWVYGPMTRWVEFFEGFGVHGFEYKTFNQIFNE